MRKFINSSSDNNRLLQIEPLLLSQAQVVELIGGYIVEQLRGKPNDKIDLENLVVKASQSKNNLDQTIVNLLVKNTFSEIETSFLLSASAVSRSYERASVRMLEIAQLIKKLLDRDNRVIPLSNIAEAVEEINCLFGIAKQFYFSNDSSRVSLDMLKVGKLKDIVLSASRIHATYLLESPKNIREFLILHELASALEQLSIYSEAILREVVLINALEDTSDMR